MYTFLYVYYCVFIYLLFVCFYLHIFGFFIHKIFILCRNIMPKDIRYLSKRRRNQLLKHEIHNDEHFHFVQCSIPNIAPVMVEEVVLDSQNCDKIDIRQFLPETIYEPNNLSVALQSTAESNEKYTIASEADVSVFRNNTSLCSSEKSLWKDLQTLIIQNNIPHNTANTLLRILKNYGHVELPSDVRVLLNTPRNVSNHIKSIGNGRYIHFGIASSLARSIQIYSMFIKNNEVKLNINIDGLPISKSSGSQFWPIMASIEEIGIYTLPIIIGVYHGMCKPIDANEFMMDFVNEFLSLSQSGITVCNKNYTVTLNAILCDAPARSFITYIKGHTGYFSCPKCTQEGAFVSNRVIFPETHNTLRTDESFKN